MCGHFGRAVRRIDCGEDERVGRLGKISCSKGCRQHTFVAAYDLFRRFKLPLTHVTRLCERAMLRHKVKSSSRGSRAPGVDLLLDLSPFARPSVMRSTLVSERQPCF